MPSGHQVRWLGKGWGRRKGPTKTWETGQPLPELLNCMSKWVGRGIQGQVCNRNSSLLGGVRATDGETRTNHRVVWSCTRTERVTFARLTTICLSWGRWRQAPGAALRCATPLRGPVNVDLGFTYVTGDNDTSSQDDCEEYLYPMYNISQCNGSRCQLNASYHPNHLVQSFSTLPHIRITGRTY